MPLTATAAPIAAISPFLADRIGSGSVDTDQVVEDYITYATLDTQRVPATEHLDNDLLCPPLSRTLISFTKKLFNYYFRNDLYSPHRQRDFLVLSSGSIHEPTFGLPASMKRCLQIALDRDWYGYSDSRGRINARTAVAKLENERTGTTGYDEDCVAISLGGTFAVSSIVDYLAMQLPAGEAICAIPNYPPLAEALARRMPVRLVETAPGPDDSTSIDKIEQSLTRETRIVLLQTVTNPTGLPVAEAALERLISSLGPQTYLILDEAHDCLGPRRRLSAARAHANVIRVNSLSKQLAIPGMKVGWVIAAKDLISGFYEYASTSYGGPPSLFYSLVDVYATFEQMRLAGSGDAEREGIRGIADRYDLGRHEAAGWFGGNCAEMIEREADIIGQRQSAVDTLRSAGFNVVSPLYSVNCTLDIIDEHSGYGFYRRVLQDAGVSVYPNVLAFDLLDSSVRVTVGRHPGEFATAIERLARCVTR